MKSLDPCIMEKLARPKSHVGFILIFPMGNYYDEREDGHDGDPLVKRIVGWDDGSTDDVVIILCYCTCIEFYA